MYYCWTPKTLSRILGGGGGGGGGEEGGGVLGVKCPFFTCKVYQFFSREMINQITNLFRNKQSQKLCIVSCSLCPTSFIKVEFNVKLVVTAQKLGGDLTHGPRAWSRPWQVVPTSIYSVQ